MPKFADIVPFTHGGNYAINVGWRYLEEHLDHWKRDNKPKLDLDPDFQRCHVWTEEKQSRYIEYILRGGKSSRDIYFNCPGWMGSFKGPMELVDGKQRLEAARKFLRNELPIFDNYYLKDYTDRMAAIGADFIFHVNNLPDRKSVLQWYLDLNTGGVVHTSQEIDKVKILLEEEMGKIDKIKK